MAVKIFTQADFNTQTYTAQGAVLKYVVEYDADEIITTTDDPTPYGWSGSSDGAIDVPLLALQISMTYGRRLNKLYPINSQSGTINQINLVGAPQGQLQIQNIYSPNNATLVKFLELLGRECKDYKVNFWLDPFGGTCDGTSFEGYRIELKAVELEQLQLDIQGGEAATINQPLVFSFTEAAFHEK